MRCFITKTFRSALLVIALTIDTSAGNTHEGHDHGSPLPSASNTIAPRAEASSSDFEVVVIARGGNLMIHLDSFRTNAPVSGAAIEIDTLSGQLVPKATGDGVYSVSAPLLAGPGTYDLAITITTQDTVDILAATLMIPEAAADLRAARGGSWITNAFAQGLREHVGDSAGSLWIVLIGGFTVGVLVTRLIGWRRRAAGLIAMAALAYSLVPAGSVRADTTAVAAPRDIAQRFADGALFVPKPTQYILAIRTQFTEQGTHRRSVELPGRIIPSPNASGYVQASVGGRLSPPEGGFKPLGTPVKVGDTPRTWRAP